MTTLKKLAKFLDNHDETIILVVISLGGLYMITKFIINLI